MNLSNLLRAPIETGAVTTFTVNKTHDKRVILCNNSSPLIVTLPNTNVSDGLDVSFLRTNAAVTFSAGAGVTLKSTPDNTFTKLAFQNSIAGAFYGGSNTWYLFGDLIS